MYGATPPNRRQEAGRKPVVAKPTDPPPINPPIHPPVKAAVGATIRAANGPATVRTAIGAAVGATPISPSISASVGATPISPSISASVGAAVVEAAFDAPVPPALYATVVGAAIKTPFDAAIGRPGAPFRTATVDAPLHTAIATTFNAALFVAPIQPTFDPPLLAALGASALGRLRTLFAARPCLTARRVAAPAFTSAAFTPTAFTPATFTTTPLAAASFPALLRQKEARVAVAALGGEEARRILIRTGMTTITLAAPRGRLIETAEPGARIGQFRPCGAGARMGVVFNGLGRVRRD
ncbi:MAG: hypothetical protein AAGC56_13220 [Pseudomonadota bacterium]